MKSCGHHNIIGDNYGTTCQDCGKVLSGYGYWAEGSRECMHQFLPLDEDILICSYCGTEISREEFEEKKSPPCLVK